jgi:hypothetical protein
MSKERVLQVLRLLENCIPSEKMDVYRELRKDIPIHKIEKELNAPAEIILEAIHRASDLTLRGIRGIIAEAAFKEYVVPLLGREGYREKETQGDLPFDFLLARGQEEISIQVKMQRLKNKRPMRANEGYSFLPKGMFVVETQKTRGGKNPQTGEDTRPYRFGEFDLLAVSMHPSSGQWDRFMYTVADWLLPRNDDSNLLCKFQPVSPTPDSDWTDNICTALNWFKEKKRKTIAPGAQGDLKAAPTL